MSVTAVIRPGETDFDQQDRILGTLDLPLNEHGESQLDEIVDALRSLSIKQLYTSPTDPALSTANAVGEALDINVKELELLANVNQGLWQGLCIDEIKRKQPKIYKLWRENPESVCPPEGESCAEAFERAQKALRKPMKKNVNFAVVVSEPMATVVECVLRREELRMPALNGREDEPLVQLIETTKPETVVVVPPEK
ncbi:MAG: histidine phosphatase family protein [Planctomycetaceae bacterium]|nr:histidine phosphatase family protein [Planctomycetaceae bacterium]